jgi:tetratricopeptide (TPR) repeat protein
MTMHHWAVTLDRAGRHSEALEQHEAALAAALPVPPKLLVAYSKSLARAERWEDAVAAMRRAADAYSDQPVPASVLTQTGELQVHLGEAVSAEASFRAALELSPQHAAAMHGMALSQRDQKRWPEAEQSFEAAVRAAVRPRFTWSKELAHVQLQIGHTLRKEEKLDEALLKYKAARDNDPRMLAALNNHAVLLHRQGEYESAIAEFKQAVSADKSSVVVRLNLGMAFAASEQWRDAEHHLSRGVQLDPTLTKTNAAMRRAIKTVEAITCETPKATGWEDLAVAAMVAQKSEAAAENLSCSGDIGLAFIE